MLSEALETLIEFEQAQLLSSLLMPVNIDVIYERPVPTKAGDKVSLECMFSVSAKHCASLQLWTPHLVDKESSLIITVSYTDHCSSIKGYD
jgi:hypothetical protein